MDPRSDTYTVSLFSGERGSTFSLFVLFRRDLRTTFVIAGCEYDILFLIKEHYVIPAEGYNINPAFELTVSVSRTILINILG